MSTRFAIPDGVPPIAAGAAIWSDEYRDGRHTVFDSKTEGGLPERWRFGPNGFRIYVRYKPNGTGEWISDRSIAGARA